MGGPIFCKACGGYTICDFCAYFNYGGDEKCGHIRGGYCRRLQTTKDASEGFNCNYFICFSTVRGKILRWMNRPYFIGGKRSEKTKTSNQNEVSYLRL